MKLSRTVEYAVQAMLQLAEHPPGEPVPCSRLAAEGKMPERFLLQILRSLVTRGILASTRGVDGGYALQRPADQISLLDVIEAVDGPLAADTPEMQGVCPTTHHRLAGVLSDITAQMRHDLANIKLSHLLPPHPRP